jgi:hypothetical protein
MRFQSVISVPDYYLDQSTGNNGYVFQPNSLSRNVCSSTSFFINKYVKYYAREKEQKLLQSERMKSQ